MNYEEQCAWRTIAGFCRWRNEPCDHLASSCGDYVKRAKSRKFAYRWIRKTYNQRTAKGRMQFHTRDVSRGIVFSQCTGKTRYPNWKRATEVQRLRMQDGSMPLRIYHCQFCGGYHLTHKVRHDQTISNAA